MWLCEGAGVVFVIENLAVLFLGHLIFYDNDSPLTFISMEPLNIDTLKHVLFSLFHKCCNFH